MSASLNLSGERPSPSSWPHEIPPVRCEDSTTRLHRGLLTASKASNAAAMSPRGCVAPSRVPRITESSMARAVPAPCHGLAAWAASPVRQMAPLANVDVDLWCHWEKARGLGWSKMSCFAHMTVSRGQPHVSISRWKPLITHTYYGACHVSVPPLAKDPVEQVSCELHLSTFESEIRIDA